MQSANLPQSGSSLSYYTFYTEGSSRSDLFPTQKPSKVLMNSQQEVSSAKLFINNNRLLIKNLRKLEPLSHLIDDEKLVKLVGKNRIGIV